FYSGTSCIYTGIAEKMYDKVKGPPDDRFFMEENEYYEEGYTKKEAVVSRGTFFEKHCFETITCECETPRLALVPTPHYIYGADKYIEFFFPAEKYSDLTNLRAIKAFINEQPFDIRKAEEGTKNEEKAGLIRQSLIKIMTAGYLNDSRDRDKQFEGSVIKASHEGARVILDCGAAGFIAADDIEGMLAAGDRIAVKVKNAAYNTGKITFYLC
ncbi:MAG: hypothetical protein PHW77_00155, partial [Eubacteriales bacterium]|nr:hypothetical protein [Eubacteriales bacterium]